jgi:transposase
MQAIHTDAQLRDQSIDQWLELYRQQALLIEKQSAQLDELKRQIEWFKRQVFGTKSERFVTLSDPLQLTLESVLEEPSQQEPPKLRAVAGHTRQAVRVDASQSESPLFFDESRLPIQTIEVASPQVQGLMAHQYEVIAPKISYRLAQRPGSYVILKYVRQVIKRLDTQTLLCAPAPEGVLQGSRADVSFLAGLLIEKFSYHNPLYRQHQRLIDSGIKVSRAWLTQITQQAISLLEPIYEAQLASVRDSRVLAMDETPIKAGHSAGKMKSGYFWPVYGDRNEVCFTFSPSRSGQHISQTLGWSPGDQRVFLTDGYAAYESYAKQLGLTHAQCWAHTRREFFEAHESHPQGVQQALEQIGALYTIEEQIREQNLSGTDKLRYRQSHSRPKVDAFFKWIDQQFERQGLLPSTPFTKALNYTRERKAGLSVFVDDADVPMDNNHLERSLRVIAIGRRNWLFCWTELGARQVGVIQSLLATCRLHQINPYDYLVDVLQRVGQHPAALVEQLTPRLWGPLFAAAPLRGDLLPGA